MVDHHHPSADQRCHIAHIVSHDQRLSLVHTTGRFIEHQEVWLHGSGTRQLKTASVAIVELGGSTVSQLPQANGTKKLLGVLLGFGTAHNPQCRSCDIFPHGQRIKQTEVLEGSGQSRTGDLLRRHSGDFEVAQKCLARGWWHDPGEDVEQGGLACTVRADDSGDLGSIDCEPGVVERPEATELHDDVVDSDLLWCVIGHRPGNEFGSVILLAASPTGEERRIEFPVVENAPSPKDHEPDHHEPEEQPGQTRTEDDRQCFDLGAREKARELVADGDEHHTGQRSGNAVAAANDEHGQSQQCELEEEESGRDASQLEHTQRRTHGHNNDRDRQGDRLVHTGLVAHRNGRQTVLSS